MTKCQKDPTCGTFLKRGLFRGIKNDIHMCQTRKYKNTNTQYTNTAYDKVPERPNMWYIFERVSKMIFPCVKHGDWRSARNTLYVVYF